MWEEVADALKEAATLTPSDMYILVGSLVGAILQRNWQRPGVCVHATMEEFCNSKTVVEEGGRDLYLMRVLQHKTARQGPARLVMTPREHRSISQYVQCVRPLLDPTNMRDKVFLLPGPRPLCQVTRRMQTVGKRYGITVLTPTRLSKKGATAVVKNRTDAEVTLIAEQMSHSRATVVKCYQYLTKDKDVLKAHAIRRALHDEPSE